MPPETAPDATPPIDFGHLRRYTLGDEALEREILGLFLTHTPQTLDVLRQSVNAIEWRAAAHGIKGSARAVGAHLVAELAAVAEAAYPEDEALRQGQLTALAEAIA
ncbi:UNVERIFIED_CONTAM: Hpt domain-containing protein, partial [Lactobacillus acidophilus]|nr:Hpt domain-containing protein [Lactobacillus acidophilus]